jgi:hypothetical protein
MAPRRVVTMGGQVVVCDDTMTTAYYCFKIDLAPRAVAVETQPTRPRLRDNDLRPARHAQVRMAFEGRTWKAAAKQHAGRPATKTKDAMRH